ncbi:nucleic-acid-binding protein from transposon X-element [Trichonephila clavipes]|nr:nucleic-acid-binding protein from transposon X-element [Trichonephila clavipes]
MANLPTDMELELALSQRSETRSPSPQSQLTPCEQLKYNKAQLAKMETFRKCKQACVDALKQMPDHYPEEPFFVRALTELQEIEETISMAVSDIDSYDPCTIPGCPHHEKTPHNSPSKLTQSTPKVQTQNNSYGKRKDSSNFEYPPNRKTARKINLESPDKEEITIVTPNKFNIPKELLPNNVENPGSTTDERNTNSQRVENGSTNQVPAQNQLPAPIMLFIDEELSYKAQMAAISKEFPKIRSRLTGEYLKLYTDTAEERRSAVQLLKKLKYQFYTFKSKAERPIKVVIKGIPRNTDPEEIKQDLELLGYTPDRVNQLIGRKTKRTLPIFLITLPRNLDNLKIFDLKTLGYLSVRVEGYDGRGVTQCYTCNKFNHTSENCHLNPRCLKCGENHITRDCPLKQKLETAYCINCNIYGHMANYRGCPSFPKPPKGAAKNNRNSYTNIYNSLSTIRFQKRAQKYNDDIWQKRLEALNTTDNSLWRTQKFFKNKRSKIPSLNCATGTAVTDQQKANLLATNLKNNFIENERENDSYNHNDENINSTVNNFLSTPPTTNIEPALPDEIIHYIKHINSKKAPGKDLITNRMLKNFPIKLILILTILVNKILKFNHFPENWKEAIIFPINKPGKDPHLATSYRPISLLSTIGKLTESIILLRLKNFINSNNLLNPNQYGFTTKLSTLHPLLRLTEHISEGFQKRKARARFSGYPESLRPCLD